MDPLLIVAGFGIGSRRDDREIVFWLAVGSVPASVAGVWVISALHDAYGDSIDDFVLTMLAIALIPVGLLVLIRALFIPSMVAGERESLELTRRLRERRLRDRVGTILIGSIPGIWLGSHLTVRLPSRLRQLVRTRGARAAAGGPRAIARLRET